MYTSNYKVSLEYSCWNLLGESENIFLETGIASNN